MLSRQNCTITSYTSPPDLPNVSLQNISLQAQFITSNMDAGNRPTTIEFKTE